MANSFEELFNLRFQVENAAGVLKSLSATKSAIYDLNKALKDNGVEGRQAFNAFLNATKKQEAALKSLTTQKQKEADNQLKIAERVTNQELALYRKLEVEKAKLMAKYGQIPASFKTMPIPMDSSFKTSGSTMSRQDNISTYRQNLQDAKLFSVEQNKLMQQEKQRTAELKRQDAELQKQLKSQQSLSNSLNGMRKAFQGFMTSSFVFKRFFDSTIEVVDKWSKMSIAMSQFRSSGNFDDVNRQLDATVIKLDGVISRYEMIPEINKAKMLGFDFSNGKLSETLEMTTKIAQMFGMDATKAFGDFTVAISKASPIIMDNIGVLLRLEESYQMYYESTYNGELTFDKFVESLTQAQKRAIYYGEAMRLLQEKTEGVSVKTNEAQSVLMRLKDAWYSLGTDLESGGGLNPIIWALEKVVSLAEAVAAAFMTISNGYKALQYSFPNIFGKADLGLSAKEVEDVFRNKKTAEQGVIEEYGGTSLKNAENFYNKLFDITVKYREELDNIPVIKDESERDLTRRINITRARYETARKDLETIQDKYEKSKEVGYSLFNDKDYALLKRYVKGIDEVKDKSEKVANMSDEISQQFSRAGDKYINSDFFGSLIEVSHGAMKWLKDFSGQNEIDLMNSIGKTGINPAYMRDELAVQKELLDIDIRLANNKTLDEALHRNYNTEKEKLTANLKAEYQERIKLNAEQTKAVEILKGEGEILAIIGLNSIRMGDRSKDQNYITSSTQLKEKWNPYYTSELEKSMKKAKDLYKIEDKDVLRYNLTDEMKKLYMDMPEGLKGTVNELEYIARPFKEKLINAITLGVEDKEELELRLSSFEEIYSNWLKTSASGAPVALLNNLPAQIAGFKQKTSSTGRTKKPKNLDTGWYELNRDLYKEILPEDAIFSKTEDARLELFQKKLDLEKLKKDIAKFDKEGKGGTVDRRIKAQFQEEQKYVEMLTKKYEQVVELANEEYRILRLQQTARQRAMYEFKVEKTTDYLTPGNTQITKQGAKLNQYKLNELNQEQAIIENEIAREAAISEEKKRISLGLQNKLTQSAKEYNDTSLFAKASEKITLEYKQKEADIIKQINKDYAELLNGKLLKINKNQKEFVNSMSAEANSWLKLNNLYEKFGRRQAEITEDFKPGKRQAEKQKRTSFWTMDAFYGIGSAFGGLSEDEELYREQKAQDEMNKMYDLYRNKGTSTTKKYGITETMFEKGLDTKGNFDQQGLETYLRTLNMTEAEIKNIQSTFEEMSGGIKSAGQRMIEDMQQVADAWKNIWQDTYRDIANVFGQGLWDSIVNTSGEALWQYKDQRKESLDEEKKNLEQGQITKEQYLNRAAIIEKNFDTQKRNLEKQSTKETLKNLGSMFFFKGLGYLIEAPIKAFEGNMAAAAAYAGAGSALMLLGGSLGFASRGYRPSQTSSFEDEASAKQQDTNIYIDNRLFEDKRQMQKLYQSSLDMEV